MILVSGETLRKSTKLDRTVNHLGNIPEDLAMDIDQFDSNSASCSSMDADWQIPKVEFQQGNQGNDSIAKK